MLFIQKFIARKKDYRKVAAVATDEELGWQSTHCFISLPVGVLCEFLLPFLKTKDIVRLDIAVMNHTLRQNLRESFVGATIHNPHDLDQFLWFTKRKCFIQRLNLTRTSSAALATLRWDSKWMVKELCLQVAYQTNVPAELLTNVLRDCKQLTRLTVRTYQDSDIDWDSIQITTVLQLKNIALSSTEEFLIRLLGHSPHLEVLALGDTNYTSQVLFTCASKCTQLTDLCMCPTLFYDDPAEGDCYEIAMYEVLLQCKKLTKLTARAISGAGFFQVGDIFTNLKVIVLEGKWEIVPQEDAVLRMLQCCPQLESLTLDGTINITDVSLHAIAKHSTHLQALHLRRLREITDSGVAAIRVSCLELHFITIECCSQVTGAGLAQGPSDILTNLTLKAMSFSEDAVVSLAQHNTNLKVLSFDLAHDMTDWPAQEQPLIPPTIFSRAVTHLPHLTSFNFYYFSFGKVNFACFNDEFMCALAQHCAHLTQLQIEGSTHITGRGFAAIATLCKLKWLDIGGCKKLNNTSLTAIAKGCPNLQYVCIDKCPRVGSVGVCALAQYRRKLEQVHLSGCVWVRDYAVMQLLSSAPNLREVSCYNNYLISSTLKKKLDYITDLRRVTHRRQATVPNVAFHHFLSNSENSYYSLDSRSNPIVMMSSILNILYRNRNHRSVAVVANEDASEWSRPESLLSLPAGVLGPYLLPFLKETDVINLDSAVMNRKLREGLLECYIGASVFQPRGLAQFRWFAQRKFLTTRLILTSTHNAVLHTTVWKSGWMLKEIKFGSSTTVPAALITSVLRDCKQLTSLVLNFCDVDWQSVAITSLLSLTKIKIRLYLSDRDNVGLIEDFIWRLLWQSPKLQVFDLGDTRLTSKVVHACAELCPKLTELCMSSTAFCRNPAEAACYESAMRAVLFKCKNLRKLSARAVSQSGLFHNGDVFTNLRDVTLSGNLLKVPQDAAVVQMAQYCPQIETLSLEIMWRNTDVSLQAVAKYLHKLQSLSLTNVSDVTDGGMNAVRNSCLQLRQIYIKNCKNITGTGYAQGHRDVLTQLTLKTIVLEEDVLVNCARHNTCLASLSICIDRDGNWGPDGIPPFILSATIFSRAIIHLPNLTSFCYYSSVDKQNECLNDEFVCALAVCCTNLTSLHMCNDKLVTVRGFNAIATLRKLESLDLTGCTQLNNQRMTAIAENNPNLESISIGDCYRVRSGGVCALAQHCKKLKRVDITCCHWVRDYAVRRLLRNARDLQYVHFYQNYLLSRKLKSKLLRMLWTYREYYW